MDHRSGIPIIAPPPSATGKREVDIGAYYVADSPDVGSADTTAQSQAGELVAIFGRHWILFTLVLLLLFGAGTAFILRQPKEYTARTTVLFDPRNRQIVNFTPVVEGFSEDSQTLEVEVATELQLILSRRVTDPVIAAFKLADDPEFNGTRPGLLKTVLDTAGAWFSSLAGRLIGNPVPDRTGQRSAESTAEIRAAVLKTFAKRLDVGVDGHSTAIGISFTSEDPEKAAQIANAIAANYVALSVNDKATAVNNALKTMMARSVELRDQTVAADRAVEDYRIAAHLVEGSGGNVVSAQISAFNSELVQAEADLAAAKARLSQIEAVKGNPEAAPAVLASPVIQQLREDEAKQAAALAHDQSRQGLEYPTVLAEKSTLAALHQQIVAEMGNIIRAQRATVESAQVRVDLLKSRLADSWKQAGNNGAADIHLRQLQLEASVQRTLYESYLRRIQEISQQVGTAQPYAEVISAAEPPQTPSWPELRLLLPAILLVSMAIAAFCVVCAELFAKGFRSLNQVAQVFGDRPVELIPRLPASRLRLIGHPGHVDAVVKQPLGPFAEAIHSLRVQMRMHDTGGTTVLFSSALANEGKTATAVAFARQEALSGVAVLMIDADMRRPSLHTLFGGSRVGLSEMLLGNRTLDEVIQKDQASGMAYIAAGKPCASPIDLLAGEAMQQLLREAEHRFERVVIDAAPVLAVADARVLTALASQTIYVVRWGSTPRRFAKLGLEMLRQSGGKVVGPIFVQVDGTSAPYKTGYRLRPSRA